MNSVKVIHGANAEVFEGVVGAPVACVRTSLVDAFNIPSSAAAHVNGVQAEEDYRVQANDILEFILQWGMKGGTSSAPFPYYGGKRWVAGELWRRFGDVKNYVEPFFGSGAVLLNRPKWSDSRIETVNDIDVLLVNFWRAVKFHPRKVARIADYPVSELDLHAQHAWLAGQRDRIREKVRSDRRWCDPEVAGWWVWGISQWIGGGWCRSEQVHRRKKPNSKNRGVHRLHHQRPALTDAGRGVHRLGDGQSRGAQLLEYFQELACRLERVRILSGDWKRVVTPNVTVRLGTTGVFLDPPYTEDAERDDRLYAEDDLLIGHEVRDWAVANGTNARLRIALCGYDGEYKMPANWSVFKWRSNGTRNGHRERVWFSPHCLP